MSRITRSVLTHSLLLFGLSFKTNSKHGKFQFTLNQYNFTGIDLEKVYQKLVIAFIRNEAKTKSSFQEIIVGDKKIKTLESQIVALENKISKEKQFNRKVEINKILQANKAELNGIIEE